MANLSVETTRGGTVAVVAPSGELDLSGAAVLQAELDRLTGDSELGAVVLDLRGLEFVDSSGLRAILEGYSKLAEREVEVTFLRPPGRLWRVFTVTGSDRLLPFDDARAAEVGPPPGDR